MLTTVMGMAMATAAAGATILSVITTTKHVTAKAATAHRMWSGWKGVRFVLMWYMVHDPLPLVKCSVHVRVDSAPVEGPGLVRRPADLPACACADPPTRLPACACARLCAYRSPYQ